MVDPTPEPVTPLSPADPTPEALIQLAYIRVYNKLWRAVMCLAVAVAIVAGVGGFAIWDASTGDHASHIDTTHQIEALVCFVVGNAKPDHGVVDHLRMQYHCKPYDPTKPPHSR